MHYLHRHHTELTKEYCCPISCQTSLSYLLFGDKDNIFDTKIQLSVVENLDSTAGISVKCKVHWTFSPRKQSCAMDIQSVQMGINGTKMQKGAGKQR